MKDMFVEYIDHITNTKNTEILNWSAFCDLSMERHIEVTFCCTTDDPRVNVE